MKCRFVPSRNIRKKYSKGGNFANSSLYLSSENFLVMYFGGGSVNLCHNKKEFQSRTTALNLFFIFVQYLFTNRILRRQTCTYLMSCINYFHHIMRNSITIVTKPFISRTCPVYRRYTYIGFWNLFQWRRQKFEIKNKRYLLSV